MAVTIEVPYEKTFTAAKPIAQTFQYLTDWENAVPKNFPGVETFERVGEDTYRWGFETVKIQSYEFGLKLVTRFKKVGSTQIDVEPMPGGNCAFQGGWTLQESGTNTQVKFRASLKLDLPIPFFLKAVAGPLAQKELSRFFDRYVARVEKNIAT